MANQNYLTEFILSLHNEVQSAVDFISTVADKERTELGKSDAVMQIETLRIKLPFSIEIESKTKSIATLNKAIAAADTPAKLRNLLASRRGFLVDIGNAGKMGSFTKVKVATQPNQAGDSPETLRGEMEIVFSPLSRK